MIYRVKNEPISQYTSNAAERVAWHYKERSLTFRVVASRVLSRAPSSLPADSTRPAAHSICHMSLRLVAIPQQGLQDRQTSLLATSSCGQCLCSATTHYTGWPYRADQLSGSWYVATRLGGILLSPWCCPCCWWWWSYWEGHIHVSWYYWLLGKYSLIKSVHSL
jgi:hypothetical protein